MTKNIFLNFMINKTVIKNRKETENQLCQKK